MKMKKKRVKKFNGQKVAWRYSAASWFTVLFGLIFIAAAVASAIAPAFEVIGSVNGAGTWNFNGGIGNMFTNNSDRAGIFNGLFMSRVGIALFAERFSFIPGKVLLSGGPSDFYQSVLTAGSAHVGSPNGFINFIAGKFSVIYRIGFFVVGLAFLVMLVFVVIEVITILVNLFAGKPFKAAKVCAWGAFICLAIAEVLGCVGGVVTYFMVTKSPAVFAEQIGELQPLGFANFMWLAIILGAALVSAIIISIIYKSFEKKVWYKDINKEQRYVYVDKNGKPLSNEEVAAANGEVAPVEDKDQPAAQQPQQSMQQPYMGMPYGYNPFIIPAPYPVYQQAQPIVVQTAPVANPAPVVNEDCTNAPVSEHVAKKVKYETSIGLPSRISTIGGHAFAENENLVIALVPHGIPSLGAGAFANCPNLKVVSLPVTVKEIGYNCFFNCARLQRVNYAGTKEQWRQIKRGSNWLSKAGTQVVVCTDGSVIVNPYK